MLWSRMNFMLHVELRESKSLTEGRANNTVIDHFGEKDFYTDRFTRKKVVAQVADVVWVVISADNLAQAGSEVNLSRNRPHLSNTHQAR